MILGRTGSIDNHFAEDELENRIAHVQSGSDLTSICDRAIMYSIEG